MRTTFIVGGKAGEGVKKAASAISSYFAGKGLHVFEMDDYPSLIRGGHNFSAITVSDEPVYSHYMKADAVVALDDRSLNIHAGHLSEEGLLFYNSDTSQSEAGVGVPLSSLAKGYKKPQLMLGLGAVSVILTCLGMDDDNFEQFVRGQYEKGVEQNLEYAGKVRDYVKDKISKTIDVDLSKGTEKKKMMTGNEAISYGLYAGGLDVYIAYPMTPASSILHILAEHAKDFGINVSQPENEVGVINMAIGSAFTGARTAVGTSGGGFALMQEGFSLAGISETPLVVVMSSRPGPATGVPTYTQQADLFFTINAGHGVFPMLVASPASVEDAYKLSTGLMNLAWKFQVPTILLTEKHLSESWMSVNITPEVNVEEPKMFTGEGDYKRYEVTPDGISPLKFVPGQMNKWTSYEHDQAGITTEDSELIVQMNDKRNKKHETMVDYLKKNVETVKKYGEDSDAIIVTVGANTLSVLEAVKHLDNKPQVVQPVYLEPFPEWEFDKYKDSTVIVCEVSPDGSLARLLKEKTGILADHIIKRYDGRPFEPEELAQEIKKVL